MVEDFVESVLDKKRVKDQLGKADTTVLTISKWRTEQLNVYSKSVKVFEKKYNDSFVLGDSTRARLGTDTLGDNSDDWKIIAETPGPQKTTLKGRETIVKFLKGEAPNYFQYIAWGSGTNDFDENQTGLSNEKGRKKVE